MGFIGNVLGLNKTGMRWKAGQANLMDTTNQNQLQNAYNQQQQAFGMQQNLAQQLAAQGGLQNQQNVFNQLQGIASGTGPNPALAQLNQATGNNIANQAALMASQRGANANAGLMARQAAMQGGNLQQQAVGQAATMQAQQQQQAINDMGNLANQQVANQMSAYGNVGNMALQGQQNLLNAAAAQNQAAVSNKGQQNQANSGVQQQIAAQQGGMLGGGASAAGKAIGLAHGGKIEGHAEVSGDSPKNDKVPALLSPGEIIVPRSAASSPEKAAQFVKDVLAKDKKTDFKGFEKVKEDEKSTTLRHPSGHEIMIANHMLNGDTRALLKALPTYNRGGMACYADGGIVEPSQEEADKKKMDVLESYVPEGVRDWAQRTGETVKQGMGELKNDLAESYVANRGSVPLAAAGFAKRALGRVVGDITKGFDERDAALDAQEKAQEQQIQPASFMPESSQEPQMPEAPNGFEAAKNLGLSGINQEAAAQSDLAKEQARLQEENIKFQQEHMKSYAEQRNALQSERENLMKEVRESKVDPNRFWNNLSSGQKARNIVGLIVSGFGGQRSAEMAIGMLDKQIDQDIQMQKDEIGKKNSLLSENLRRFGDLDTAMNMTKAMHADMLAAQLDKAAANAASPMVKAKAMQAKAQLLSQYQPMIEQAAQRRAMQQMIAKAGPNADPAMFINLIPERDRDQAASELRDRENAIKTETSVMKAFEKANKEVSVFDLNPFKEPVSLSQFKSLLYPMVIDVNGKANEGQMEALMALAPAKADSPERINEKKASLQNFFQLKKSAPIFRQHGMDLDRFKSSSTNLETRLSPEDQQKLRIARANPGNPAAQAFLRSRGLEK